MMGLTLDNIELSVRARHVLENEGLKSIGHILVWKNADAFNRFDKLPGCGRHTSREIEAVISRFSDSLEPCS